MRFLSLPAFTARAIRGAGKGDCEYPRRCARVSADAIRIRGVGALSYRAVGRKGALRAAFCWRSGRIYASRFANTFPDSRSIAKVNSA